MLLEYLQPHFHWLSENLSGVLCSGLLPPAGVGKQLLGDQVCKNRV